MRVRDVDIGDPVTLQGTVTAVNGSLAAVELAGLGGSGVWYLPVTCDTTPPPGRPFAVYLAGPIDDVTPAEAETWRTHVGTPDGVVLFSPAHAYTGASPATAAAVDKINRAVISACDALLANLSGPGRGFGTVREIEYARALGKPVAVVGDVPSLLAHDVAVCADVAGALASLTGSRP